MLKVVSVISSITSIKSLSEADVVELWVKKINKKDLIKTIEIIKKSNKPIIYKTTSASIDKLNEEILETSEYIDIDSESDGNFIKNIKKKYKRIKIIISHHNFKETPYEKELAKIAKKILKKKPDIIKLAFLAKSVSDSFRILDFLQDLNKKGIKAICVGMGEYGLLTRVAGDLFGNYMMYFAQNNKMKSAPGQITIKEFKKFKYES